MSAIFVLIDFLFTLLGFMVFKREQKDDDVMFAVHLSTFVWCIYDLIRFWICIFAVSIRGVSARCDGLEIKFYFR